MSDEEFAATEAYLGASDCPFLREFAREARRLKNKELDLDNARQDAAHMMRDATAGRRGRPAHRR